MRRIETKGTKSKSLSLLALLGHTFKVKDTRKNTGVVKLDGIMGNGIMDNGGG